MGLGCARAVNHFGRERGSQKVTALAVRINGKDKHARIIQFMHAVPSPVHERLQHWVTSDYTLDLENHLFNYKNRNGRIIIPTNTVHVW